jgi:hypothetical protein
LCSDAALKLSATSAGFRLADEQYIERLKLSLCAVIGVLLSVLVAMLVFPVRARARLRKRTAKLLERMGNLAFYLMGEFCEVRSSALSWNAAASPLPAILTPGYSGAKPHLCPLGR